MHESANRSSLVDPVWLERHAQDPNLCLIEIAGNGQEQLQAYSAGHIPSAHAWRWKEWLWDDVRREFPSPELFARRMGAAGIGNDTTVVFYGEGMQFGVYAWWVFRMCGHANVRLLDGARERWRTEGLPLTTDVPSPRPPAVYRAVGRSDASRVHRDEVLQCLGRTDMVLLDARSPEEYRGELASPPGMPNSGAERLGRIPGAKHLHFEDLLAADKRFRSDDELSRLFQSRGVDGSKDVIAYCRLSHRASVLYFVLTELLGMHNVRIYDGSWTEWGNLVGVPIENDRRAHSI